MPGHGAHRNLVLVTPTTAAQADTPPDAEGKDRRVHPRLTPEQLQHRLTARHKYGEAVTLVDLSGGGVQLETPRFVRPDSDLALEIVDATTREVCQLVSRVVRARVAALRDDGGVTYRAACAFKRPWSHASLLVPASQGSTATEHVPERSDAQAYLKLELALKTIVEGYFKVSNHGNAGRWRDPFALIDALSRLCRSAERRRDPIDHQLAALLATVIPALQRREATDEILRKLQRQLASHVPLLAIRTQSIDARFAPDRERVTLNVGVEADRAPIAVTAEFESGFGLDATQFRLLKLTAYLVGLVENWNLQPTKSDTPHERAATASDAAPVHCAEPLPLGWHRVVLRYVDGPLLRGYSNDFHADRAHLHVSPSIGGPASDRLLVPVARLKAVFFVKDFEGDPQRVDDHTFDYATGGRRAQVTFRDGETMLGSTLNYRPNGLGFFLLPASASGNNIRVYVVNAAIRHMRFL